MTAPPADRDRVHARWVKWVELIKTEIIRAHWHQAIWTEVRDDLHHRYPEADASFLVSYSQLYGRDQLVRIRSLIDSDPDTASLLALIASIQANAEVLDFNRYAGTRADRDEAFQDWQVQYSDVNGLLDVAMLNADMHRLAELSRIKSHVDQNIAHLQRSVHISSGSSPTVETDMPAPRFEDVRSALDTLGDVCNTYSGLLTGSRIHDWTPIIQADWHEPLREGLFIPEKVPDSVARGPRPTR